MKNYNKMSNNLKILYINLIKTAVFPIKVVNMIEDSQNSTQLNNN